MSEFRRRLMMAGKALPYDAEVEYLQSDGSAYINTMIKGSSSVQFDINIYLTSTSKTFIFGSRIALNKAHIGVIIDDPNAGHPQSWRWGNTMTSFGSSMLQGDISMNNLSNKNTLNLNNISATVTNSTFSSNYEIHIFGQNNAGSHAESPTNMRLKSAKFYSNSVLVLDLISVRVGQVGYMYDKVSGELFGNANSVGAFTYGNDVNI